MKKLFLILTLMFLNCAATGGFDAKVWRSINSHDKYQEESIEELKEAISNGFDINSNLLAGFTALHYAVLRDKPLVCKFLVENGANPHIENCDCDTPYDLACGNGKQQFRGKRKNLMDILILSKCNVFRPGMNSKNYWGGDESIDALKSYNSRYNLNLEMGKVFE